MEKKQCSSCRRKKPVDEFYANASRSDGLHHRCKKCHDLERSLHYLKNKDKVKEWNKKHREQAREILQAAKFKCADCGETHPAVLDLHHIGEKDSTIRSMSEAVINNWGPKRLAKEIAQCVCLCANCHRKRHWNEQ